MYLSRLSHPSQHWASTLRLLCSVGIAAGLWLVARASDAVEIEIRQGTTSAKLAANPDLLALAHYQGYTLIEDWQGDAIESSGQSLGQTLGVAVAPDGTVYLPATFGLGWQPPGSSMRWKQNLPLPIEAAASDPESHLVLAAAGSLHLFPDNPDGIRISIALPPEVRQGVRLATDAQGNVAVGSASGLGGFAVVVNPLEGPEIYSYGAGQGLTDTVVQGGIAVDGSGRFVVGTRSGLFVGTGPLSDLYFERLDSADGLPDDDITAIAEDGLGGVAIGTGHGLALWDGNLASPSILTLTRADGLVSDWIPALTSDRDGHVIAAQPGGIAVVTLDAVSPPEDPVPECSDGIDNDGDELVDLDDPGCGLSPKMIEQPACDDGIDNDGDGLVDFDDPICTSTWTLTEQPICGLGFEFACFLAPVMAWRARRRRVS